MKPRLKKWLLLLGLSTAAIIIASCATVSRTIVRPPEIPGATFTGSESCAQCHADKNKNFATSDHARLKAHGDHAANVGCNLVALVLLLLPVTRSLRWLDLACVLAIVGIWIEKGMGLVVPGFIPSPLGEIVEYTPSLNETLVCFGIWAFGILCYTLLLRVAVPILQGRLTRNA